MSRLTAILAATVVVAVVGGTAAFVLLARPDDEFAQCRSTQVAGGAGTIGGAFTLVDQTGATVTDTDVITEPTLLYFGYTFCPDVCPVDIARNAVAIDVLAEQGISATPVFISVDPKRDTPDVLKVFAENLHPKMIALSGSDEQVKAASNAYRTYYQAHEPEEGDEYYLVDHSTFTYLVLPEVGFVEFFRREIDPEAMAQQVACFVDQH